MARFTRWLLAAILGAPAAALAQTPPAQPVPDMQAISADLGVTCSFCHAGAGNAPAVTAAGKPRLDIAREMIRMTADLNARVQAVSGKPPGQTIRVRCVTCHRGVTIPRQLQDIVWQTTNEQGPDAAVAQYRDLRARYYGRQSYDFGEDTLLVVADRLAQARPPAAIALAQLNLEFYPQSARSYVTLAIAQSRSDLPAAIASLKKALEIDPQNAMARGRLYQLEEDLKRRQR